MVQGALVLRVESLLAKTNKFHTISDFHAMVEDRLACEAQYIIRVTQVFPDLVRMQKNKLQTYSFGDVTFSVSTVSDTCAVAHRNC